MVGARRPTNLNLGSRLKAFFCGFCTALTGVASYSLKCVSEHGGYAPSSPGYDAYDPAGRSRLIRRANDLRDSLHVNRNSALAINSKVLWRQGQR